MRRKAALFAAGASTGDLMCEVTDPRRGPAPCSSQGQALDPHRARVKLGDDFTPNINQRKARS